MNVSESKTTRLDIFCSNKLKIKTWQEDIADQVLFGFNLLEFIEQDTVPFHVLPRNCKVLMHIWLTHEEQSKNHELHIK